MTTLQLKGLTKAYSAFKAVDDLSLTLRDGEFLSLLGPSGCGKTTTLRMIAGFITPTEGSILLDGQEISSPSGVVPPDKRQMSMIFQSYAIWPNMTVAQNVGFGLRMKKLPKAQIARQVAEVLEVVQLDHLASRYPAELSGGQQQRVALARAVALQPKVMLLDEPLSNLDANLREDMRSEIKRMHTEYGITTVYVTHDQSEAMAISDRIAVINAGRIEQIEAPHRLYSRPRTRFAAEFIGRTNLIEGRRKDGVMIFPSFRAPSQGGRDGPLLASVRPQTLRLSARGAKAAPAEPGMLYLPATVEERIFLGERWDYGLLLDGGQSLRAAGPPEEDFPEGSVVWIALPEAAVIPVEDTPVREAAE